MSQVAEGCVRDALAQERLVAAEGRTKTRQTSLAARAETLCYNAQNRSAARRCEHNGWGGVPVTLR